MKEGGAVGVSNPRLQTAGRQTAPGESSQPKGQCTPVLLVHTNDHFVEDVFCDSVEL